VADAAPAFTFEPGVCRTCKAPVLWAVSDTTGAPVMLDKEPITTMVPAGGPTVTVRRSFTVHPAVCTKSPPWPEQDGTNPEDCIR
jgi:hypothetical protein